MTLFILILTNVVLGSLVVYGLLALLGFGIRSDRVPETAGETRTLPRRDTRRLAA